MSPFSGSDGSFQFFRFLFKDPPEFGLVPILRLSRRCFILAACAALFLVTGAYFSLLSGRETALVQGEFLQTGFSSLLRLIGLGNLLNLLGLLTLAGAVYFGVKTVKQAVLDSRRYSEVLQEAKQRSVEIAALYDITQDVSTYHDLPALLQTIATRATALLGGAGCAIFLYDADRDDFQIAVESGVGMPIGSRLSSHEGLGGRVTETMQSVIVNDYQNWPYRSKALMQLPISATVCVPMIRRRELIGVLGVHEVVGSSRKFTDADARLLSLFADNAAGAVYNARLMEALKNSEERFRIAAECASDIVYDWDMIDDHVDFFGTLFGRNWGGDAVLPKTREEYSKMVHPDDRARVRAALKSQLQTRAPYSEEYRIQDSRGACITISDRATAIRDPKGVPVRMIGVVSDITERKNAEKMKSDFVSFVTHQLRTPLSGIKWMLELASGDAEDPEEIRSFVRDARASTE